MTEEEASTEVEVSLQQQNPKLTSLPEDLDAAVAVLDASENELPSLPPSIGTLSKLRVLNVSDNKIAVLPEELGNCEALEELLLYKNQIKKLPASCGKLKALRVLVCNRQPALASPPARGPASRMNLTRSTRLSMRAERLQQQAHDLPSGPWAVHETRGGERGRQQARGALAGVPLRMGQRDGAQPIRQQPRTPRVPLGPNLAHRAARV